MTRFNSFLKQSNLVISVYVKVPKELMISVYNMRVKWAGGHWNIKPRRYRILNDP